MQLMPIAYVSDVPRAVRFYGALGLTLRPHAPLADGMRWAEIDLGDATLALHGWAPLPEPSGRLELHFSVATGELDAIFARAEAAGLSVAGPIRDEGFGRFFVLHDPDGLAVQINEMP